MRKDHLKKKSHSRLFKIQLMECTLVYILLILSYGLSGVLIYRSFFPFGLFTSHVNYFVMSGLIIALLSYYKFFRVIEMSYAVAVRKILYSSLLVNTILLLLLYFLKGKIVTIYYFIVAYVLQFMVLVMIKFFVSLLMKKSLYDCTNLVIVQDINSNVIIKDMKRQCKGRLMIALSEDPKLKEYVDQSHNIYLTGCVTPDIKKKVIAYCDMENKRVFLVPEIFEIIVRNSSMTQIGDTPVFEIGSFQFSEAQSLIKRVADIIISVLALIVTSPIMLLVIIGIKMDDGGPVFYKQERCGLQGRTFNVIKFRSMVVDAEKYCGAVFAEENDPRITKVGRIIRLTRIDEIPQFFNVLEGSMSVVGPRPERPVFVKVFSEKYPEYSHRLSVKPGITGLAQVTGNYTTSAENKIKFDLMYIINYSVLLDLKILLLTFKVVFKRERAEGFINNSSQDDLNIEQLAVGKLYEAKKVMGSYITIREVLFVCLCILVVLGATFCRYDHIVRNDHIVTTVIKNQSQIPIENLFTVEEEPVPKGSVIEIQGMVDNQRFQTATGKIVFTYKRVKVAYLLYKELECEELIEIDDFDRIE
ncbi:sugar transferase [Acidaminobacter hydrogenoformans]|uniref:Exopolysaccharide biosynthesis polyprenyl glycosylphosphotransferase n=1 Tax=Acidaminobacter hydrogenoformans DSM 2784 TaxID=1120920 RepID=A0A1G5RQG0_9FIRM|nr:sugar transferase [Acidaminobacter hydrogenoformans]SCZ76098.1 exopolysaccharide biosynthesis polyprenyl glycosylphosphotransferase [Acidaminobacter hydrogenoformans DSM 2784]